MNVDKESLLDSIRGYYVTTALLCLLRLGILENLTQKTSAKSIAEEFGLDPLILAQVFEFLSLSTSVISKNSSGFYRLNKISVAELTFNLEKFAGAYGPALQNLGDTSKTSFGVNQQALANAFIAVSNFSDPILPALISDAGIGRLLDVGCGTGSLLIDLALKDTEFYGIGLDKNRSMCKYALQSVRSAGLTNRIKIKRGDGSDLATNLTRKELLKIDGVYGRSFLNEFFGTGDIKAIRVLNHLHKYLPGRKGWFVDYFGQLGKGKKGSNRHPLTLLQDIAQVVSGQGVPPPDTKTWRKIYGRTECDLVRVYEFENSDIRWFIHEVVL